MIRKKKGAIEWLEFELFSAHPEIQAAVFLRHGGVSKGPYASLNMNGKGDDPKAYAHNRSLVFDALGINHATVCDQPHQAQVSFLPKDPVESLAQSDGMMTNRCHEALLIRHADCQAAVFFDPVTKTIANVHAGWRGQVLNIYQETVDKFKNHVGARPENLLVAISPSLGPKHAEFIHFKKEWPEEYWQFQCHPTYFDLWAIGEYQLIKAGICPSHIQFAKLCTYSNPEDFFSYRRQKPVGGHATIAYLTKGL
ncbi:MAG: peptidoglycan editing factor PgeF [Anaplasmataceae bacterium]|nr:peptidoglycan editing factor PgeF [Anaplasmataceae bacterium]